MCSSLRTGSLMGARSLAFGPGRRNVGGGTCTEPTGARHGPTIVLHEFPRHTGPRVVALRGGAGEVRRARKGDHQGPAQAVGQPLVLRRDRARGAVQGRRGDGLPRDRPARREGLGRAGEVRPRVRARQRCRRDSAGLQPAREPRQARRWNAAPAADRQGRRRAERDRLLRQPRGPLRRGGRQELHHRPEARRRRRGEAPACR